MKETDVLVIGGGVAGIVAATTGKRFHSEKDFVLIRREQQAIIPSGIPYIFGGRVSSDENIIPDSGLLDAGVRMKVGEVISIDQRYKLCKTADGETIKFDRLILALGSVPTVPRWPAGLNLQNVFTIPKDKITIDKISASLHACQKVIIVGGGFIGVEVADQLKSAGKDVTIAELLPHILDLAFDEEFAVAAEDTLRSRGINVITSNGVNGILGEERVRGVVLDSDDQIEADAVILAMGYRPDTALARTAGIELNSTGFIKVDEYMETDNPSIFAVGDCAEKKTFLTRTPRNMMLASTACAEARIAALNLYRLSAVRTFGGTIAVYSTVVGDTAFGVAGLTESIAREKGYRVATGTFDGIDKHPGTLVGAHRQIVKLVTARESGLIIGAQIAGGESTAELTNLIGLAIQSKMTVNAILTAQISTHPLLTASPTAYPLVKAAEMISQTRWVE